MNIRAHAALILFVVGTCAASSTAFAQARYEPSLNRALEELGLTQESARIDTDAMAQWGGDRYLLRRVARLQKNPWALPVTVVTEAKAISAAGSSLFELLRLATRRTDEGVYRGLRVDPVVRFRNFVDTAGTPLIDAIIRLYDECAVKFAPSQKRSISKETEKLAPGVKNLLATFVHACAEWVAWRNLAFRKIRTGDAGLRKLLPLKDPSVNGVFNAFTMHDDLKSLDHPNFARTYDILERVDLQYLYTGALDLVAVCDYIKDSISRMEELCDKDFTVNTPLGRIVVNGSRNHEITSRKKYLLIIDAGGDDIYRTGGCSSSYAYHTGIIIDRAGNDQYLPDSSLVIGPGGGVMGLGLVYDLGGDDLYRGGSRSLGAGIIGVGGIWDQAGDDQYQGEVMSQGAGMFGVGVLADLSGSDTYYGVQKVQGFGSTRGCGILYDREGDDRYWANDSTLSSVSMVEPGLHGSLAQGTGFGFRDDDGHGHSMAGGIGYLIDEAGDDQYEAGVYAQGCGYWHAMGMLVDLGGHDEYRGGKCVQGAAVHFGVGALHDAEGNDRYVATLELAQGAGHDFGQGMLWDHLGNDIHTAPPMSLGSASSNGVGIFRDDQGDDTYVVDGRLSLGHADGSTSGSLRDHLLTLGIFLDLGGADTYPASVGLAGNDTYWHTTPYISAPGARGVGLDSNE